MQQTTSWSDTQKILAFVLVVAFIVVIFVWMAVPPKADAGAVAVLNTLVGTLGSFAGMVVTFYFGSSRTSATKDQTIAALTTSPPGQANAAPANPPIPPA